MIDEDLMKEWVDNYERLKAELPQIQERFGITIPQVIEAVYKKTKSMSDVFKELAITRQADGNIVPVIMGYIMADTLTHLVMSAMTTCALTNQAPHTMAQAISTILYNEVAAPLAMTQWENVQKDLMDDFLAEESKL